MDNELLELCKEVYKRTGWGVGTLAKGQGDVVNRWFRESNAAGDEMTLVTPSYTSDYLLEKLPHSIGDGFETRWLTLEPMTDHKWSARYGSDASGGPDEWGDTALKSLLKLTIALHEAGELK